MCISMCCDLSLWGYVQKAVQFRSVRTILVSSQLASDSASYPVTYPSWRSAAQTLPARSPGATEYEARAVSVLQLGCQIY